MIGLFATYFVVAYLFVPSGLFRLFYSLFLPRIIKFQRTRVEELTFAILTSVLPFMFAFVLSWYAPVQPFSAQGKSANDRKLAYRTVIATAISDKAFNESSQHETVYWDAASQVIRRQADFLIWYYLLTVLEGILYARLTVNYGLWRETLPGWRRKFYLWIADYVLLPSVSEWHLLLNPFYYPPNPSRQVWVDVLTNLDVLYKGHVNSYFLDKDGDLSGIVLESPRRFDRQGYMRDAQNEKANRKTDSYWRDIPSNNLYIPSDKITNLNVRYLTEEEAVADRASAQLSEDGFEVESAADLLDPILLPLAKIFEENKDRFAVIEPSFPGEEQSLRSFLAQQIAEGLMESSGSNHYRLTAKGYVSYLPRVRRLRERETQNEH